MLLACFLYRWCLFTEREGVLLFWDGNCLQALSWRCQTCVIWRQKQVVETESSHCCQYHLNTSFQESCTHNMGDLVDYAIKSSSKQDDLDMLTPSSDAPKLSCYHYDQPATSLGCKNQACINGTGWTPSGHNGSKNSRFPHKCPYIALHISVIYKQDTLVAHANTPHLPN